MEFLQEYVVATVMAICFAVGYILKNIVTTDEVNKFIPLIMGALGIFLNTWINGFVFTPEILLGGLASGLASTGAYELVANLLTAKEE